MSQQEPSPVKPSQAPPGAKRPYAAPTVQRVELRPEEAVLGACKTTAGPGPRAGRCRSVQTCSTLGS
jgi:hypothetical protein